MNTMTLPPPSTPSTGTHAQNSHPTRRTRRQQFGHDVGYLLGNWPMMLVAFILVFTLLSVGVSTVIIWVGLPIMVAGAYVARGFATVERRWIASVNNKPVAANPYLPAAPQASGLGKLLRPLADPQAWLDVLWSTVGFILSTIGFSIAVTWLAGAIGTVGGPLASIITESIFGDEQTGLGDLLGVPFPLFFDVATQFLAGLVFLVTAPFVLRGWARLQSGLSDQLLNSRAQITHLTASRDAVRKAETDSLRRLERDIHDGPQQRLVRLNMDLARAKRQAAHDPERAEQLIGDAMEQTQQTLAELRQLSRGIAPPVLVDRGLEAAITEAGARSIVPVTLYSDLPDDLPDHVETAAYFVVSEALANVNKHSQATSCDVFIGVQDQWLFITITDNGLGGASLAKGHGLSGLADRVAGVDGTLTVTSPEGGPTTIEAVIPCRS
ncbi:sensor histidine kinase [Propionibacteriaceae bacterium G1746]|uniref:sensor histidine kinase n=1 Tax=Aestuariimicrobium sp. G57 TaxID=3418485 RepID=UPI003C135E69